MSCLPPFKGKNRFPLHEINAERVANVEGIQAAFRHEHAGSVEIHGTKPGGVRACAKIGIRAIATKDRNLVPIGHRKRFHGETRGIYGQFIVETHF